MLSAVVYGLLREPLGNSQIIAGSGVEPPNKEKISNPLYVTESSKGAWGAGVAIEIRGLHVEKGKHYRLEGFELGEFVGTDKNNPEAPPLHYNPFFVVTKVLDLQKTATLILPADIKITFAEKQNSLPQGIPKDVRNEKIEDTGDAGPLSKIAAGDVVALDVASSDPKRFKSETQTAAFLRQLLTLEKGSTWKFEVWSQGIQPMLVVNVEHTGGKLSKWYIGPNGEDGALSAYQDGAGKWWFSSWKDLTFPKSTSPSTSNRSSLSVESFRFIDAATTIEQVEAKLGKADFSNAGGFGDIYTYYLNDGTDITIGSTDGTIQFVTHDKDTLFGHTMFEKK